MRRDEDVKTKDPGPKLSYNVVNELRAYQSYPIKCDQETKRRMKITRVLQDLPDQDKDKDKDKKISLQVKEWLVGKQKEKKEQVEIFLSVVTDQTSDMIPLFRDGTLWKASSRFFVLQTKIPFLFSQDKSFRGANPQSCELKDNDEYNDDEDDDNNNNDVQEKMCIVDSNQMTEEDLLHADVGKLTQGEKVQEHSGPTSFEYDYRYPSQRCHLLLSLCSPTLHFRPSSSSLSETTILAQVKDMIQSYIDKKWMTFYNLTYENDTCCICLELLPNIKFYPCGHVCVHQACLKENNNLSQLELCPFCRKVIVASYIYKKRK